MISNSFLLRFFALLNIFIIVSSAETDLTSQVLIFTTDNQNQSYAIYNSAGVLPEWKTMNAKCSTCHPPATAIEFSNIQNRSFTIKNIGKENIPISKADITAQNPYIISISNSIALPATLAPGENKTFEVKYDCKYDFIEKNELKGWTYLEMELSVNNQPIKFDYLKICSQKQTKKDYSIYILLTIAVLIVATATRQKKTLLGEQAENVDEIQPIHAIFFIVFASATLMILYFFSEYIKGILSLIFVAYALVGCSVIFTAWTEQYFQNSACWSRHYQIPFIGAVSLHSIACFAIPAAVVGYWYFTKHWIANNVIGLSIVSLIFRVVKLPSLKVAYLLLGMAFIYDIFWVFASTPIFGKSVMVVAASSLDLPIKIEWPYFGETPLPGCSLLGLGDMVLPGFFVTFNYRFSLYKKTSAYYWSSVIAYALGIGLCGAVLVITNVGQPALLYIVPCALGAATIVSCVRGEFKEMWAGIPERTPYVEMDKDMENSEVQMKERV